MIIRKLQLADFDQVMAIWLAPTPSSTATTGLVTSPWFMMRYWMRRFWLRSMAQPCWVLLAFRMIILPVSSFGMRTVIMGLERSFCERLRKAILHLCWRYMPRMSVPFDSTGGKGCRLSAAKSMRRTMPSTSCGGRGSEEDIILADTLGECYNKG